MLFVALPVYKILELMPINMGSYYIVHFIFLISLFRDLDQAGPRHRLIRKRP